MAKTSGEEMRIAKPLDWGKVGRLCEQSIALTEKLKKGLYFTNPDKLFPWRHLIAIKNKKGR